jgi:uncharacterized protein (DUF2147 family)
LKKEIALILMVSAITGFCFAADQAEGYWLSIDEKTGNTTAGWQVYQQGGKLFGKILSMSEYPKTATADRCRESYAGFPVAGKVNQMTVAGTPWIYGLSMDKPGEWSGGSIVNPEDGKLYKCKIIFRTADGKKYKTDVLEMRGEIGLGIGRSQFWQRTDESTAGSLGPK